MIDQRPGPNGWWCGCGWANGINLDVCAACGRTPVEGSGVPFEMNDAELRALTAVVEHDVSNMNMQMARYGEFQNKPDYMAAARLRALLEQRGVVPPEDRG